MNLADEFTALIVGLQAAHIDFAVCGGWAMALHGFPRLTRDIDFLVQPDDLLRILDIAKKCGYEEVVETLTLGPRDNPTCVIRRINKFQALLRPPEERLSVCVPSLLPPSPSLPDGQCRKDFPQTRICPDLAPQFLPEIGRAHV